MPWVKFIQDFDWRATPAVTFGYKAGSTVLVTTPCAKAAKAAGKAENAKPQKGSP